MSSTPRTLSKGTLGLKFMNRQSNASPTASTSGGSPSVQTAANVEPGPSSSSSQPSTSASAADRLTTSWSETKQTSSDVIYSSSLLSFPLLSASRSGSLASPSAGRQSFGGVNKELEKSDAGSDPPTKKTKSDQPKGKKRQIVDLSQGARDRSSTKDKKRAKRQDEQALPAKKKQPLPNTFQRPAGFEGAKKANSGTSSKAVPSVRPSQDAALKKKMKKAKAGGSRDADVHVNYPKAGETRDWDIGKEDDDDDDDSDDLRMPTSDDDDNDDESSSLASSNDSDASDESVAAALTKIQK